MRTFMLLLSFVLITACGNKSSKTENSDISAENKSENVAENESETVAETKKLMLKSITKVDEYNKEVINFGYDEKNRIKSINDYKFTYTGDNVIEIAGNKESIKCNLDNNLIVSATGKDENGPFNFKYSYDKDWNLTKISQKNQSSDISFKYKDNEIKNVEALNPYGAGISTESTIEYDTLKNVTGININNAVLFDDFECCKFSHNFVTRFLFAFGYTGLKNNLLWKKVKFSFNEGEGSAKFSYKFNDDGYPIEIIIHETNKYWDSEEPEKSTTKYMLKFE